MQEWIVGTIIISIIVVSLYWSYSTWLDYRIRREKIEVEERAKQRRDELHEILKMKSIVLDQSAIKVAAEKFMQALVNWKDRDLIKQHFKTTRISWTEEELDNAVKHESNYIDPVIKVYQPIYDVAIRGEIDQPLAFSKYMHSFFTGFYWDQIRYPEITDPLEQLSDLFQGGLTAEEFMETDYYKNNRLPKMVVERIEELRKEGKY